MKSINILTGLALLCLAGNVTAQNQEDALRYSRLDFGGTARIQGIGGVQTALGGDASNLAGNPAGLGLFRRSELSFTPGLNFNSTSSNLDGYTSVDQRSNVNLSGFGLVFSKRKSDEVQGNWRGGSFGIGFTRQSSFQNRFNYSAPVNGDLTMVRSLAESTLANGFTESELDNEFNNGIETLEGLAYATYLTGFDDYPEGRNLYYEEQGNVTQSESILTKGAQNQWDFSYGASYRDKIYLGASLGVSSLRFNQERVYQEIDADPTTEFTELTLRDEFTTTGTGINLKAGIIVRPIDAVRIGASIQTPTLYAMRDIYNTSLSSSFEYGSTRDTYEEEILPGDYKYNLITPLRANGGVAFILGKYGFISGDVEYVNYGQARLNDEINNNEFRNENDLINTSYNSALNFKLGAEGRFDIFRVRAGYALYSDPYQNSIYNRQKTFLTAGVGIKQANYFLDLAVVNSKYDSVYEPYMLENQLQPRVSTQNKANNVLVTFGMNF